MNREYWCPKRIYDEVGNFIVRQYLVEDGTLIRHRNIDCELGEITGVGTKLRDVLLVLFVGGVDEGGTFVTLWRWLVMGISLREHSEIRCVFNIQCRCKGNKHLNNIHICSSEGTIFVRCLNQVKVGLTPFDI